MITGKDYVDAIMVVKEEWGDNVLAMVCLAKKTPMTFDQFLDHCTACGGNWGGMLLTGVRELWPEVWDIIPDGMGVHAFATICNLLILLGVDTSEGGK